MRKKFLAMVFVILTVSLVALSGVGLIVKTTNAQDTTGQYNFEDNSVIVTMEQGVGDVNKNFSKEYFKGVEVISVEDLTRISNEYVKNIDKEKFHQILKLELEHHDKEYVLETVEKISEMDGIACASPNYIGELAATANDPEYYAQWGLRGARGIGIASAWNIETGSSAVRVGVIDSGISWHEDLIGNLGEGESFVDGDDSTEDVHGHGTHVAGIIGAVGDNQIGISGVCKDVTLIPLKISNSKDWDTDSAISAITYATALWGTSEQIDLLNFSGWNFPNNSSLYNAIDNFPGLFVGISGNGVVDENDERHGYDIDATPNYPANFNCANIICVGSIDSDGSRSEFSNYGANSVDIYAPGGNILSTVPGGYGNKSGTSMAAPHVAGVAALMLSVEPGLHASRIKDILLDTADDITISIPEGTQTVKKLNAYSAVSYVNNPTNLLFDGGKGTVSDPYLISTAEQFNNIRMAHTSVAVPNVGYEQRITYSFKLMNNLTLPGDWVAFPYVFTGNFDGNGRYISYQTYLTQGDINGSMYHGLFGFVAGSANIHDLELMNCSITSNTDSVLTGSGVCIGILAGGFYDAGYITNVTVTNPNITCLISDTYIGGLVGSTYYTSIENCVIREQSGTASITNNASSYIGGMAGTGEVAYFSGGSVTIALTNTAFDEEIDRMGEVVATSTAIPSGMTANVTMDKGSCIVAGSLITLSDGRQVPVETLTGEEMLLVWNLHTGTFDEAPILFLDFDSFAKYTVVRLTFSDGTELGVVSEHGLWDCNLNEYVYLDKDAAQYLGHTFLRVSSDGNGNRISTQVTLIDVEVCNEFTAVYSPVTEGHLCYYVNGMLSMPGGIEGLFNLFEVDGDRMAYDEEQMQADIAQYGLYTYEEFAQIVPVSEEAFDALGGQYLKVAVGKGLIDVQTLESLALRYGEYLI
ncbi:MAG: S8 family serine peptidase [Clostridia bacterium]|nr:S8 family serine peptidase [Clostridia bacterium]